jgi:release factor glutamine methyltransferase
VSDAVPARALLAEAERILRASGIPDPRAEAELLLARSIGVDRAGLIARLDDPIDRAASVQRYREWIDRRAARTPFQHITGRVEFHGLPFRIGPEALVPRPETEGLVDVVLDLDLPDETKVADLGTGSGCIAVTIAHERPSWRIRAIDLSSPALDLARRNAECLGVGSRIEFRLGSMVEPPADWNASFDLVVSNPPYVAESAWRELEPEVRDHEPKLALVAGATGLEMYRALAPAAFRLLRPGGVLAVELGHDSEAGARSGVVEAGFTVDRVVPDLAGIPRVLVASKGSRPSRSSAC